MIFVNIKTVAICWSLLAEMHIDKLIPNLETDQIINDQNV